MDEETLLFLDTVSGLPPDNYKRQYCDTPDRQEHWKDCRLAFSRLHATLVNHFTGLESPLESIPADLREPFFLWREYYVKLQALLAEAWGTISDTARSEGLPLPETPGKLLIELLHDESDAIFAIACPKLATGNDYFEFSPRAEHDFYREGLKVSQLIHSRNLSRADKQRIERYRKQAKRKLKGWERFKVRLLFCLNAAERASKKNSFVKRKLREFNKADADWQVNLISAIHPSKSPRGFAYRNGQKLLSNPKGGVYNS